MAYYRCTEGHVFKRTPSKMAESEGRTKCGRCGETVRAIPCPEAEPPPTARRNPFAPSIMRQRNSGAERLRREKYRCAR